MCRMRAFVLGGPTYGYGCFWSTCNRTLSARVAPFQHFYPQLGRIVHETRRISPGRPYCLTRVLTKLRDPTVNTTTFRRLLKTHFSRAIYTSSALEVKT